MTAHQSLPAATGNLINPIVTPTYPPVIPDLSSSHNRLIRQSSPTCPTVIPDLIGDLRTFGLGPSPRRKDAKRMTMGTCYAGFPGHAN